MHQVGPGSPSLLKHLNRALIVDRIRTHGPTSRVALSRALRLSAAAVSNLTDALIHEGFLREGGPGSSAAGRKPTLLELNRQARFAVGIDLERIDEVRGAVTDLGGGIVLKAAQPLPNTAVHTVVAGVGAVVEALLRDGHIDRHLVAGVGVGTPGLLDSRAGIVLQSVHLGWRDVPLRTRLQERLRLPVLLDTDTNAPAMGELWYGAGRHVDSMIYLTYGRGVGVALIIGGRLYRGAIGVAGEFGHCVIDIDGPPCKCGNRGCLEALVAEWSLPARAERALALGRRSVLGLWSRSGGGLTPQLIYEAALLGDEVALEIIAEVGHVLGLGLVNLINLLNPSQIILGGDISQLGDILLEPVRKTVSSLALIAPAHPVRIVPATLGRDVGVIGAATLVLDRLFQPPVFSLEVAAADFAQTPCS